ncbi:Chromo domain-like protein [Macrophomina phaseolina MS6]|uniref:Chromo domain-like protein n=1 Tax=Macrophomina phaseolina (strain MS6) TaxID=1126212 RepID=K2RXG0_MACPH|nr:Chromo domain-like protein [Macrophomina phaseolina MS6]
MDGPNHVRQEDKGCDGLNIDDKTSDGFWSAERILRESKTHYLISWAPSSGTGRKFKPTWEPKENANEELREEWESRKTRKKRKRNRGSQGREDQPDQNSQVVESTGKPADLSEGIADANKAGYPRTVNNTAEVVNPNPSSGIAPVFTLFPKKVITCSKKQRRLPQRPLQRFLPDAPDSRRESITSDEFECP